jgi:hypothetical protein
MHIPEFLVEQDQTSEASVALRSRADFIRVVVNPLFTLVRECSIESKSDPVNELDYLTASVY